MNAPSPRVWLATFVTLVFTIGLLAGIVVERTVLHPGISEGGGPGPGGGRGGGPGMQSGSRGRGGAGRGGPMFGPPPDQYVEELSREVTLTAAQRTEILSLLRAQETRLQQMQDEARQVFIAEQQSLHERIAAVMTPEQATAFRSWTARRTGRRGSPPR